MAVSKEASRLACIIERKSRRLWTRQSELEIAFALEEIAVEAKRSAEEIRKTLKLKVCNS